MHAAYRSSLRGAQTTRSLHQPKSATTGIMGEEIDVGVHIADKKALCETHHKAVIIIVYYERNSYPRLCGQTRLEATTRQKTGTRSNTPVSSETGE